MSGPNIREDDKIYLYALKREYKNPDLPVKQKITKYFKNYEVRVLTPRHDLVRGVKGGASFFGHARVSMGKHSCAKKCRRTCSVTLCAKNEG